jgi:hypothetical protein
MRQTFIIGAIVLWVAINILGNFVQNEALMSQGMDVDDKDGVELTQQGLMGELQEPEITDFSLVTVFTKVGNFLKLLGRAITLYHPALWQGSAFYVYLFLIAPIGVSFWVVFVMALRGIGSS